MLVLGQNNARRHSKKSGRETVLERDRKYGGYGGIDPNARARRRVGRASSATCGDARVARTLACRQVAFVAACLFYD